MAFIHPTIGPSGTHPQEGFTVCILCTSIVERQNLSVRMGTRRFTRLTNAFSKKWENHWAAVSTWFAFYNFCRVHKSLRVTPAMAAGIADHVWDVRELLAA